jgi:hypothetical protein
MNDEQKLELAKWLNAQAYSGEPGTDGPYLRLEELLQYLPGAVNRILNGKKAFDF